MPILLPKMSAEKCRTAGLPATKATSTGLDPGPWTCYSDSIMGSEVIPSANRFRKEMHKVLGLVKNMVAAISVAAKLPYLVQRKIRAGEEIRRIAQLDWKIIEKDCKKPFVASGLDFIPLPVMHGEDYVCLGFLFGKKYKVSYISDVSRFLPTTEHYISKESGQQLDLLILDAVYKKGFHNTHFCLPQALDAIKKLCPKRALLTGMTHEFDHHVDNEFLLQWSKKEGILVQLAHDGMKISMDL